MKKYYGGREITEEDLQKALLVGMSPHEKRRLQKKKGIILNTPSNNTTPSLSSSKKHEPKNGSVLDSDVESEVTDPSAKPNRNGSVHPGSDGLVFATCSSKLSLLGHGPHGKQVVDFLLKEHGEDGVRGFCQRWRQVFVEAIHPRFLPGGWDVTHR